MNDIIEMVSQNPVAVLVDEKQYSEFYKRVREEVTAHVPDVTTVTGRGKIAALAYKVVRSKTAIDAAGKKLNEEARAKINAVDAQRRKIREELDALALEVRRPLTVWEEAEKVREGMAKTVRENIVGLGNSSPHETSDNVRERIAELSDYPIDADVMRDEYDEVVALRDAGLDHLRAHLERAEKAEADAAELARLRAEAEERAEAERQRIAIAKEAAEREARAEAERVEAERQREAQVKAAKAAEIERIRLQEQAEADAKAREERARQEEADKARAEQERIQREAEERVAKAEAEARAVLQKAEAEERVRLEAIERTKREEEARQTDRAHRSAVMKAAKEAIMAYETDEETAKKIVLAIVAGEIPNVRMGF